MNPSWNLDIHCSVKLFNIKQASAVKIVSPSICNFIKQCEKNYSISSDITFWKNFFKIIVHLSRLEKCECSGSYNCKTGICTNVGKANISVFFHKCNEWM